VSWTVHVQRSAEKELASVSSKMRQQIGNALHGLENDPFPHGVKKLKAREGYRLRVGDYRILFTVDRTAQVVRIGAIGHRGDVYR
jgi:mRNA interferase RelE/StbE